MTSPTGFQVTGHLRDSVSSGSIGREAPDSVLSYSVHVAGSALHGVGPAVIKLIIINKYYVIAFKNPDQLQ